MNSTLHSTTVTAQNIPCAARGHQKLGHPHQRVFPMEHGPSAGKEKMTHTSFLCPAEQVTALFLNIEWEERAHLLVSAIRKLHRFFIYQCLPITGFYQCLQEPFKSKSTPPHATLILFKQYPVKYIILN